MIFGFSIETLAIISLIVFFGCLIQGIIGYGFGMFSAPLLFMIEPALVPGPMIIVSTLLTAILFLRSRIDLQCQQVAWTMGAGLLGVIAAGWILSFASGKQFQLLFGGLIVLAVMMSLAGYVPSVSNRNCTLAGLTSGLMGTLTAVGGPPVAILYQTLPPNIIKANLSAFFLLLNTVALITLFLVGTINKDSFGFLWVSLPSVVLGFWCSGWASRWVKPAQLRKLTLSFSGLAGVISIIRALA